MTNPDAPKFDPEFDCTKPMSFIVAARRFFGFRPGDTLKEFSIEMKKLTPQDRLDLTAEFHKIGWNVTAPTES